MKLRLLLLATAIFVAASMVVTPAVRADEGWTIRSFDALYEIQADGSVLVVEDIAVDFGLQQKHGIIRYIPLEYRYDPDTRYRRVITITGVRVDDGLQPHKVQISRDGANLVLKIGDPDLLISGPQRYRISYRVEGALNPQQEEDEFFWNVTGLDWPVRMEAITATVRAAAVQRFACYQGRRGSTDPCDARSSGNTVRFQTTHPLPEKQGLTVVTGLPQGSVAVAPLKLTRIKSPEEKVRDFIGLKPIPLAFAGLLGVLAPVALARYWWLNGRDRWLGDLQYLTREKNERHRPLFARDTVIVEYLPPELVSGRGGRDRRRLRPAEIGTLLDERADTLDVTATIVDLAVRGYLSITEMPKKWLFGSVDYRLEKLNEPDESLLSYEDVLLRALFADGESVDMSDLRNEFYSDLARVKRSLYSQVTTKNKFFPHNPDKIRQYHAIAGIVLLGFGITAAVGLGQVAGAAIVGLPIVLAGLLMLVLSTTMSRRTGTGREMYRRVLGFRKYMTVAETDRQRFNEETNLFQEYLPYAIVFECVDKWAKAFEGLERQPDTSYWYRSPYPFQATLFSRNLASFSSSISSAIASTPGGSGSSGFSGGSSGGGVGGGGGGSW